MSRRQLVTITGHDFANSIRCYSGKQGPTMAETGGKKTFLAIVLGGIALLALLVGFVVYGVPAGGNTENLTVGMPKPTVPKKH
jgi:hypothetical protein